MAKGDVTDSGGEEVMETVDVNPASWRGKNYRELGPNYWGGFTRFCDVDSFSDNIFTLTLVLNKRLVFGVFFAVDPHY